jgi:hypothetical protein
MPDKAQIARDKRWRRSGNAPPKRINAAPRPMPQGSEGSLPMSKQTTRGGAVT